MGGPLSYLNTVKCIRIKRDPILKHLIARTKYVVEINEGYYRYYLRTDSDSYHDVINESAHDLLNLFFPERRSSFC